MEKMEKEQLRMIPLTDEFMKNKTILDRLWVYLQLNSYIGNAPNGDKYRFVYNEHIGTINDLYYKVIETPYLKDTSIKKHICCYNTLKKSFDLLENIEYIKRGKIIDCHKRNVDVIYLKTDFGKYKLISVKILNYLMELYYNYIIKIYVYLLNCYDYKKITNDKYRFTIAELAGAIGYKSNTANKDIERLISELKNKGFIAYHKQKITINNIETYNIILDNVASSVAPPPDHFHF